jgi:subtilisin family serine protease
MLAPMRALLLLLLSWVALVPPSSEAAPAARVDPALQRAIAAASPGEQLAVEVMLAGGESLPPRGPARRAEVGALQDRVLAALPANSFVLVRRYRSIAGLAGRATAAGVAALAGDSRVAAVYLDGRVRAQLVQGSALIGATAVHGSGYTGAGVRVAVLDSGIDTNHPDLADDIAAQHCFCSGVLPGLGCCPDGSNEDDSAEDDAGHGTSVSGIITSSAAQAPLGVAPNAEIVAVKVLDSGGGGSFSDVAAGLDWVLTESEPGGEAVGVRVVNMSLGDGVEYASSAPSPCTGSATASAVAALHTAGIAVFVASGNDGHDQGVAFPACVAQAISVGGVYDANVGSASWCGEDPLCVTALCTDNPTAADTFVCHTNSGALLDPLAPDYQTRTSALGGGVETSFGGTSAACPYAAAEAALLIEADPTLTPDEIRSALVASGPLVENPESGLSFPRADVEQAIASLRSRVRWHRSRPGARCSRSFRRYDSG